MNVSSLLCSISPRYLRTFTDSTDSLSQVCISSAASFLKRTVLSSSANQFDLFQVCFNCFQVQTVLAGYQQELARTSVRTSNFYLQSLMTIMKKYYVLPTEYETNRRLYESRNRPFYSCVLRYQAFEWK